MARFEEREVHQIDANDLLDGCAEDGVIADAIITDPPYQIANDTVITRKDVADIDLRFGSWDVFDSEDAFLKWTFQWVDKANKVLRPGGIFISFFDRDKINILARYLVAKHNYKRKNYFAFVKKNPAPQIRGKKFMVGWEAAIIMQKPSGYNEKEKKWEYKDLTYNNYGQHPDWVMTGVISGKERKENMIVIKVKKIVKEDGKEVERWILEKKRHPTQKPEKVIKTLVGYWTARNDVVVDPFTGVATIPAVCEKMGRRWYASELDETWAYIGKRRIEKIRVGNECISESGERAQIRGYKSLDSFK